MKGLNLEAGISKWSPSGSTSTVAYNSLQLGWVSATITSFPHGYRYPPIKPALISADRGDNEFTPAHAHGATLTKPRPRARRSGESG